MRLWDDDTASFQFFSSFLVDEYECVNIIIDDDDDDDDDDDGVFSSRRFLV